MVDNERVNKVISLDRCLKHRFLGCFAYDTFPDSGYREVRFSIVSTSSHYYTSGHWFIVACKQNKLVVYDSFSRHFTTFFPEMLNAVKSGLRADRLTNIYQVIRSYLTKQTLQSSLCVFYCILTAHFFITIL